MQCVNVWFDEQTDTWVTSNTVRGYGNTFILSSGTVIGNSNTEGYLPFKFRIGGKDGLSTTRSYKDANWILYRMADVLLMKAEALIWKGGEANFAQALELINKIRTPCQRYHAKCSDECRITRKYAWILVAGA